MPTPTKRRSTPSTRKFGLRDTRFVKAALQSCRALIRYNMNCIDPMEITRPLEDGSTITFPKWDFFESWG